MKHTLSINDSIDIDIKARQRFSEHHIKVMAGEIYEFSVDPKEKWVDLICKSNANGFNNKLLSDKHKRVPGHKCFKLCGTIERDERNHFAIGMNKKWEADKDGDLYFFPNDSSLFYWNNWGKIRLSIIRVS